MVGFEHLIEDEEDEDEGNLPRGKPTWFPVPNYNGSQEELPNVAEISSGKVLAAYKRDQEKDDE
jgi:hypothetical protein